MWSMLISSTSSTCGFIDAEGLSTHVGAGDLPT